MAAGDAKTKTKTKTKMERVAISLTAGDATNLELRLLKVVEEVLGKHAKARQPRVKQDERRGHHSQECRLRRRKKFLLVTLQFGGHCRPGGTARPRLPRRLARRGRTVTTIGHSGSAIVFGWKSKGGMNELCRQ